MSENTSGLAPNQESGVQITITGDNAAHVWALAKKYNLAPEEVGLAFCAVGEFVLDRMTQGQDLATVKYKHGKIVEVNTHDMADLAEQDPKFTPFADAQRALDDSN
jgi:hypothetical protein